MIQNEVEQNIVAKKVVFQTLNNWAPYSRIKESGNKTTTTFESCLLPSNYYAQKQGFSTFQMFADHFLYSFNKPFERNCKMQLEKNCFIKY